jgi:hypothetical protein
MEVDVFDTLILTMIILRIVELLLCVEFENDSVVEFVAWCLIDQERTVAKHHLLPLTQPEYKTCCHTHRPPAVRG